MPQPQGKLCQVLRNKEESQGCGQKGWAPPLLQLGWLLEMLQCWQRHPVVSLQAEINTLDFRLISCCGLRWQQSRSCWVTGTIPWCHLFRMRRIYRSSCHQRKALNELVVFPLRAAAVSLLKWYRGTWPTVWNSRETPAYQDVRLAAGFSF